MIKVNIGKAKLIAHEKRRKARAEEFKPLDLEATIPMFADQAEEKRQAVRDKYTTIQTDIDAATTVDEIKSSIAIILE